MISAERLVRTFAKTLVVDELSLTVRPGEIYGFLGPNGAGKTTSLRMLAGLLEPTAGRVEVCGSTYAAGGRKLRGRVGWMPDTPPLFDDLTPRQHVALVASLYGLERGVRDERCDAIFDSLYLQEHADRPCRSGSHGTKKKVHLAALLVVDPDVLLLDEPSTGLDPRSAHRLGELLRERRAAGRTILLSTHVLGAAERLCDRVGIIDRGKLRAEGTIDELRALATARDSARRDAADLEQVFLRLTEPEPDHDADSTSAE